MHPGQDQDEEELHVEPARLVEAGSPDKIKPGQPSQDHGWRHDGAQQAPFHDLEGFGLDRAGLGRAMIDKQSGQIEDRCHPGDDRDDMQGLDPEIAHDFTFGGSPAQPAARYAKSVFEQNTTAAIEVIWIMPGAWQDALLPDKSAFLSADSCQT